MLVGVEGVVYGWMGEDTGDTDGPGGVCSADGEANGEGSMSEEFDAVSRVFIEVKCDARVSMELDGDNSRVGSE
jgi:hypothetical protein